MNQLQLEKENGEKQQRLLKIIDKVESQLENFQGQNLDNLIMLVGKTGSGKSTIYNFLCGAQFSLNIDEYGKPTLILLNESNQFQEIKGGLDSTTKTPKIYYDQKYQHTIIDYPGFNDTEINDQLEIQLLFNKLVTFRKIKVVYVFLNPGDDLLNKAEDLQNFINEAGIDISKLTILINSYSKKRTNEQLIAGFQQQFMKKYNKKAHKLIIQRDIDKPAKIQKYLSEECRQQMWMELIDSKEIDMKPYALSTYQEVNNYIDNASLELSESLLSIFKELKYKQYSTQQIEEVKENIKQIENTYIIIQKFQQGEVSKLNEIMMFAGIFQENYIMAVSKIYSFFFDCKNQMEAYTKMEKFIIKALQNIELGKEYLCLKQNFLEQLQLAEDKKKQLEEEKQLMKKEKGKMEEKIRIKEDELIQLKELLVQAQVTQNLNICPLQQNNTEYEIRLFEDQAIQESKRLNEDNIQIKQELSNANIKNSQIEIRLTQLQNEKNNIIEEFQSVKNAYNQILLDFKMKEFDIKRIQYEKKQDLDQIKNLEQQLKEIKEQKQEISDLSQEKSKQYKEMKCEFKKLKKENIDNKKLINDRDLLLQQVQHQNTLQIDQLKKMESEIIEIKDQKQQLIQSFQEIQKKYQEIKEELKQSKIKNQEIQHLLNNKEFEFTQKCFYYQQVCNELNEMKAKFQVQKEQCKLLLENIKNNEDELKKKDQEFMKQSNENRIKELNVQKINLECNKAKFELEQIELKRIKIQNDMDQQNLKLKQAQEENQIQYIRLQQYEEKEREFQQFLECIQYDSNNLEKFQFNSVIVLIGMIGSGKTTLFNKICKAQEKVKAGGSLSTRQSIIGKSAYGHGFFVIDTPGLGSDQDKIDHAVGIQNAVQDQPLNKIIFAVKFDSIAIMINELLIQMKIFQRYQKMFVVFVTHFDLSKNKENDKMAIEKEIQKIGIQSVLFFKMMDSGQNICDQIHTFLNQTIPRQVEITQEEFLKNFDLFDDDEIIDSDDFFRIEEEKAVVYNKIKKMIFLSSKDSLQNIQQSNNPDEMYDKILKELKTNAQKIITEDGSKIFTLKKISLKSLEQQQSLTTSWFDSVEKILSYKLQKELFLDIKNFNQQALEQLSKNKDSILSKIKICNYCGLIWYCQTNCINNYYCNGDFKQRNNSQLDEFFWTVVQFIFNISGIQNQEIQRIKQIILLKLRERYDQNNYYGCNNQLQSISNSKITFEFFDFNLDFFIQPNQFFLDQSKYQILDKLIQKKKKMLIVKRLSNQQLN